MPLSRDDIIARIRAKPKVRPVTIERFGDIFLRVMTGGERDELENIVAKGLSGKRALIALFTVCDENGDNLFTRADLPELGKLPYSVLDDIFVASAELNEITAEAVEGLKKRSETASGSDG